MLRFKFFRNNSSFDVVDKGSTSKYCLDKKNDRNSVVIEELVDTDLSSKIEKSSFLLLLPIYYYPM